jgi:hypothetical protein
MAKRTKRVSTKHVGKAIQLAIRELKAVRSAADVKGKKRIDRNVTVLAQARTRIMNECGKGEMPWIVSK